MSSNQSRFEKSEYKKPSRSGNSSGTYKRSFINKNSAGAGGGSGLPHLPVSSDRGFKETNNVNLQPNVVAPSRTQHNRVANQPPIHGLSVTAASEISSQAHESTSSQRSHRDVPKAPSSQSAAMSTPAKSPTTPVKEEAPKPIAIQFGSISPGFVNGMQIPARTSSAPPNLDEQKRNQARMGSFQAVPTVPVPAVPQQQLPEKEAGISKQVHGMDPHSVSRAKKEPRVSPAPPSSLPQKPPTIPIGGIPMQVPFLQQQVHLPYGAPNPPIQPQGLPGASIHMPLPMHSLIGNAPQLQHQIFMPNIQPHPVQHQGMMHQGQGMSFNAQIGPHISHQFGNLGMNVPPRYTPQRPPHQTGNFSAPRKAVVITHPDTREELKLDKRGDKFGDGGLPGSRSHLNAPVNKLQTNSSNMSRPASHFYPNSFNSSSYFVWTSSLSVTNAQRIPSSHAPRINPASQGPPASGFGVPYVGCKVPFSVSGPSGLVKAERGNDTQVEGYAISVKGDSPKLGGQGDAKPKKAAMGSNETSINLSQDSKSSIEVSTVSVRPPAVTGSKDKAVAKQKKPKSASSKRKKKCKELLQKADAADSNIRETGSRSKGVPDDWEDAADVATPEAGAPDNGEQREELIPQKKPKSASSKRKKELLQKADAADSNIRETGSRSAGVPDDWEDAADVAIPEAGAPHNSQSLTKKYSRDFLLKFRSQNYNLPEGFSIAPNVASVLLTSNANKGHLDQNSYPSPGRHTGGSRSDRYGAADDDNRSKLQGHFVHSRDNVDSAGEFRSVREGNSGVLRHPHQAPDNAMHGNNTEGDRWQHGSNFQQGLLPSPQTPTQMMHKAEKKYELDKAADEELDAADVATPEAGALDNGEQHEELIPQKKPKSALSKRKKKFKELLKKADVASVLLTPNAYKCHLDQNSYPSPGSHTGGSSSDHHGAAIDDDDKWSSTRTFGSSSSNDNSAGGFRSVRGGNSGVLRHPHQAPGQFPGVNHSGPPQSINAMHGNNTEGDRWQRGSNFQKGLLTSPQTPTQMMHKAENKYELGKAAVEELDYERGRSDDGNWSEPDELEGRNLRL